jgi:purine nucleoside phosphorylase
MGVNPLIGSPFKPQFVDMRDCYNSELRKKFMGLACKNEVHIQQGVYVA